MKLVKNQLCKILLALVAVLFLDSWIIANEQGKPSVQTFVEQEYISNNLFYEYKTDESQLYQGDDIVIDSSSFVNNYADIDPAEIITINNRDVTRFSKAGDIATYEVTIEETGFYEIELDYVSTGTSINDIKIAVFLNDELPFREAQNILLKKAWKNANDIIRDKRGNDITPKQVKENVLLTARLKDMTGKYSENFSFYLEEGINFISIYNTGDLLQIDEIRLVEKDEIATYAEYIATKSNIPMYSGEIIRIQGENADLKSDHLLYPRSNRTSPSTTPSHPSQIRINAIGGSSWVEAGSWIEWDFEVPEDAMYSISIKYQQDNDYAFSSPRIIYVDGEIPYEEFVGYNFEINNNWELETLQGEENFLVHLSPGMHTIRMEVSLGEKSTVLRTFEESLLGLNTLYKDVIMYTGTNPDTIRDYNIEETITDFQPRLITLYANLTREYTKLKEISASEKRSIAEVDRILYQIEDFIEDDDDIIERLASFKGNISALAIVVDGLRAQALEVDYIEIHSLDAELEDAEIGFFSKVLFDIQAFFASFTTNYDEVSSESIEGGDVLNVWVTTGRDQASIIRALIDETFTSTTNISVNLSIVDTGATLLQAALAGKGPDVAILVPKVTPINLAMRGGLYDLREFDGIEEMYDRFFPSAFIPYEFDGGLYAIPETQSYNMMFYRKDIFDDLGLEYPETWDEFYNIISVMQKNNLQVGLAEAQWTFETLLFQRGETFYKDDLSETNFDTQEALDAFTQWTDFYNIYGLDRTFDFYNRFRTGEMPIAIHAYIMYNQLTVAAPELYGLWDMVPIPGMVDEYGNINRAEGSTGTGSIILKDAENPQAAFEFIDWWTSAETMASYGNELEMVMGPASRFDTANIEAFHLLPWSEKEKENLLAQWEFVTDVPQIPGNYYIERNISNAFRRIVTNFDNSRETLTFYNKEINAEIERKRKEFGLE